MKTIAETYRSDSFKLAVGFVLIVVLVYFGIFLMLQNLSSIHDNLEAISAQPSYTIPSHHVDVSKNASEELDLLSASKIAITHAVSNIKYILLCGVLVLIVFITVIFRDAKRNKRYRDQIIEEKRRAQSLASAKQQFIANMSHEMKTPLHAINGFTNELLQNSQNEHQTDILSKIENSSARLVNMVEDLLILSNEAIMRTSVQSIPFDPAKEFTDIANIYTEQALEKGLDFMISFPLPDGIVLLGDPFRLNHILHNLLDNSFKFTKKGTVELAYHTAVQDERNCVLYFSVKDTGIGIDEERLKLIFHEFEQLDGSITKEYSGIGIGLSVTKKLVEWQGGSILVKSTPGEFTEFMVSLPYVIADSVDLSATIRFENSLEVLVVDDDSYNLIVASSMLKKLNCHVELASGGVEALEMTFKKKYDLILMDIHMPKLSGIDTSKLIRSSGKNDGLNANTPIIALTATFINEKQTDKFRQAGINDYLSKPYNEIQLWKKLLEYTFPSAQPVCTIQETMKIYQDLYNLDSLKEITADDPEFLVEMLETFIVNNKASLKIIQEAYELKKLKEIGELAHKMLSSYQHLKVVSLYETLATLEGLIWKVDLPVDLENLIHQLTDISENLFQKLEEEIKAVVINKK
ncbi:MAG: response regulator [Cytophagales bacterium]|nr:response regulator [Cytophaga sp.]